MAEVYNWQLGREMSYPHEAHFPEWQFAFVFNPNRCIGCQTCTMACKSTWTFSKGQELIWWNNVESKPFGGYPQNWDSKLLNMLEEANPGQQVWNIADKDSDAKPYGTFKGKTIFEAAETRPGPDGPQAALGYLPTDDEWKAPNIHEDTPTGGQFTKDGQYGGSAQLPEHKVWFFHLARICNHCTYPGCLASCPRQAIYKRPEDGIVLIDQSRCRGYRKCVEGCPYKKAMYRPTTRTSEKCIGCFPRIEGKDRALSPTGAPAETRCMAACVGKIRLQGLIKKNPDGTWADDPQNPLHYLIRQRQVALPLYPQFGTEPNGFYIPPRWVPRDYLIQMFGPGVDHAIEQYSCPDRELLAVLQLFRASQQIVFRYEIEEGPKVCEMEVTMPSGQTKVQELYNDTVIAYGSLYYYDDVGVFIQFLDAQHFGAELPLTPIDRDRSDLTDILVDLKLFEWEGRPVYVRGGRQEIILGSQRLVSNLDWANTLRTFQGVRFFREGEKWDATAFWLQPIIPNPTFFDSPDERQNFIGIWTTYRAKPGNFRDLYVLNLENSNPVAVGEGGVVGGTNVTTLGTRSIGDFDKTWLYDFEGMVQVGRYSNQNLRAAATTVGGGYVFNDVEMKPQIWVCYDFASGDAQPGAGNTFGTFNQLYPFGHYYLGYLDLVARQNIQDFNIEVTFFPTNWITVILQHHSFNLAQARSPLFMGLAFLRASIPPAPPEPTWATSLLKGASDGTRRRRTKRQSAECAGSEAGHRW